MNLDDKVLAHMRAVDQPQHSTHVAEALGVDSREAMRAMLRLTEVGELNMVPHGTQGAVRWVLT